MYSKERIKTYIEEKRPAIFDRLNLLSGMLFVKEMTSCWETRSSNNSTSTTTTTTSSISLLGPGIDVSYIEANIEISFLYMYILSFSSIQRARIHRSIQPNVSISLFPSICYLYIHTHTHYIYILVRLPFPCANTTNIHKCTDQRLFGKNVRALKFHSRRRLYNDDTL